MELVMVMFAIKPFKGFIAIFTYSYWIGLNC